MLILTESLSTALTCATACLGRAAMLGFVAAVVAELRTGQSVWSQLAGKYVDGDLTERAIGTSTLLFGAVVVLLTYASIAPQVQTGMLLAHAHCQDLSCFTVMAIITGPERQ